MLQSAKRESQSRAVGHGMPPPKGVKQAFSVAARSLHRYGYVLCCIEFINCFLVVGMHQQPG